MNEEIKEILDKLKSLVYDDYCLEFSVDYIERKEEKALLDYITNLQQDLDKANDIIEKDRQFYKCRMDEYVDLKKENERLKVNCNIGYEELKVARNYKSRCKKAIEYIKMYKCDYSPYELTDSAIRNVLNILNGGDENE